MTAILEQPALTPLPDKITSFIRDAGSVGVRRFRIRKSPTNLHIEATSAYVFLEKTFDSEEGRAFQEALARLPFGPTGRLALIDINDETFALRIAKNDMTLGRMARPCVTRR